MRAKRRVLEFPEDSFFMLPKRRSVVLTKYFLIVVKVRCRPSYGRH